MGNAKFQLWKRVGKPFANALICNAIFWQFPPLATPGGHRGIPQVQAIAPESSKAGPVSESKGYARTSNSRGLPNSCPRRDHSRRGRMRVLHMADARTGWAERVRGHHLPAKHPKEAARWYQPRSALWWCAWDGLEPSRQSRQTRFRGTCTPPESGPRFHHLEAYGTGGRRRPPYARPHGLGPSPPYHSLRRRTTLCSQCRALTTPRTRPAGPAAPDRSRASPPHHRPPARRHDRRRDRAAYRRRFRSA